DGDADGGPVPPTVTQKDPILVGGDEDPSIVIGGTAEPGSTVEVTIGDINITTAPDGAGAWLVVFEGDDSPEDGASEAEAIATAPDGGVVDLDGPLVIVDLTPPDLSFGSGTVSTGDIVNAEAHAGGIEI